MKEKRFYERQTFLSWNCWFVWVMLIGILCLFLLGAWQQMIQGVPWGNNPMSDGMLIGVIALLLIIVCLFAFSRLETKIDSDGIAVRFFPFVWQCKFYSWDVIETVRVTKYRPLADFGGWGVRCGISATKAYTVSGNTALVLQFKDGKKLFIGTRCGEEIQELLDERERK